MHKTITILCIIAAAALAACTNGEDGNRRLMQIDSLLDAGQVDSAYAEITAVKQADLHTPGDSALFYLLHTQAAYRLYKPVKSMKWVNFAIKHYSQTEPNKERLATAYFYKGSILYNDGDVENGVKYIKNAEFIAEKTRNHELRHKIYEALVVINEEAGEDNTALGYSWKSVAEGKTAKKTNWLAHAYNNIAVLYARLGKNDSSETYLKRSMALMKYIPKRDRLFIMNNIGVYFMKNNPERAKRYFQEIIAAMPMEEAYENLASIYAAEGNSRLAEEMWNRAMSGGNLQIKDEVLHEMFRNQAKNADFIAATATAERLIRLKDSIEEKRNDYNVAAIQAEFDSIKSKQQYERHLAIAVGTIIAVTLAACFMLLYLRYKQYKTKAAIAHDQMMIKSYEAQIAELERHGKSKEKEIEAINRRREKLIDKHRDTLNRGYQLFSEVQGGGTTVLWKKHDFESVIEYYRLVDAEFVDLLDNGYDSLSPKYKFFLVMEHTGKTDAQLMAAMGVAEVSLRSIRSRINKRKV